MQNSTRQYARRFLALFAIALTTLSAAFAAAQENPASDPARDLENNSPCANLGVYVLVGGTGGFDALRDGNQFAELLQTGHVGMYQHANAIAAAEEVPGLIGEIEQVFSGTGTGEAELGQVGWNYFTLPPATDITRASTYKMACIPQRPM
jgi:hypothetical protein